jgi:hypothetical protein
MEYIRYIRVIVANVFRRFLDLQDYIPKRNNHSLEDEGSTGIKILSIPQYDLAVYHALGKTTRSRFPSSKAQGSILP